MPHTLIHGSAHSLQPSMFDLPLLPRHPAKYSDALLPVFARMLQGATRLLDPFAGTGRIFELNSLLPGCEIHGIEIEPEWARMHPKLTLGNALSLPWPDGYFDAICTSPVYGNRMSDHHNAKDGSRRNTYRHCLGRPLHPDNAGALQWGEAYQDFHVKAWTEARRMLCAGGRFVLNISDHIRKGEQMPVTDWHIAALVKLGFTVVEHRTIETPRQRHGANGHLRTEHESVILFQLEMEMAL